MSKWTIFCLHSSCISSFYVANQATSQDFYEIAIYLKNHWTCIHKQEAYEISQHKIQPVSPSLNDEYYQLSRPQLRMIAWFDQNAQDASLQL